MKLNIKTIKTKIMITRDSNYEIGVFVLSSTECSFRNSPMSQGG